MQRPDDGVRLAVLGGLDHRPTDRDAAAGPPGRAAGIAAAAARLGVRVDLVLLGGPEGASPWATPPGTTAPDAASVEVSLPVTGEPVRVTISRPAADGVPGGPLRSQLDGVEAVVAAPSTDEAGFATAVLEVGRSVGALTVLHPDLSCPDIVSAFSYADVVTVNLRDAGEPLSGRAAVEQFAGALLRYGPELVAAAAGGWGTLFAWTDGQLWWPAPAAADRAVSARVAEALTAGLTTALAEGQAYPDATRFAAATCALATRLPGIVEPFASRRQVHRLLAQSWHGETIPAPVP